MSKKQWFEVFVDSGNGTETLEICETLKEAKKVQKTFIKSGLENVYIDKWEDIDSPKIIKSY